MADEGSRYEVTVLGGLGALLILINGLVDFYVAAVGSTYSAPVEFTNDLIGVGLVSVLFAVLLAVFVLLYHGSESSTTRGAWALLITIFAAFSLWTGGGFLVGFLLAFVGGVIGIVLAGSSHETPIWAVPAPVPSSPSGPVPTPGAPAAMAAPNPASSPLPPRLSGIVWYCRRCECDNPTDSRVCRHCGTPLMVND
jgi:hypothetical protein